jgi:hypothetical protein
LEILIGGGGFYLIELHSLLDTVFLVDYLTPGGGPHEGLNIVPRVVSFGIFEGSSILDLSFSSDECFSFSPRVSLISVILTIY